MIRNTGSSQNWYKINYRATVGWVYKTYVRLLGNSPDLPIPDTSSSQPSNIQAALFPLSKALVQFIVYSSTDTSHLGIMLLQEVVMLRLRST